VLVSLANVDRFSGSFTIRISKFQVKTINFDGMSKKVQPLFKRCEFRKVVYEHGNTVSARWKTCNGYIESFLGNLPVKEF